MMCYRSLLYNDFFFIHEMAFFSKYTVSFFEQDFELLFEGGTKDLNSSFNMNTLLLHACLCRNLRDDCRIFVHHLLKTERFLY